MHLSQPSPDGHLRCCSCTRSRPLGVRSIWGRHPRVLRWVEDLTNAAWGSLSRLVRRSCTGSRVNVLPVHVMRWSAEPKP